MKQALIIFIRNPVYGKVKTRLAATIGDDKALKIYKQLVQHTYSITHQLKADKIVFYADAVEKNDVWKKAYKKQVQHGSDLGKRMIHAFNYVFENNYMKAVIIGTDCPEITEKLLLDAFEMLDKHDVVIGPAADGGYYLIGMKILHKPLFEHIEWSTNTVFATTITHCDKNNLTCHQLPILHDVDEERDLQYIKEFQ